MIYQLADHIQGFLSEHNRPPSRSFHEEMLKNQRRQQEKLALEEQQRMDQRRKQEEEMVRTGGITLIRFYPKMGITLQPILGYAVRSQRLQDSFMLFIHSLTVCDF